MISVKQLEKTYQDDGTETQALRGVTFDIKAGEFVAIMGPSGSGKSTLLQLLSFLDRPTGGHYAFDGRDVDELSDNEFAYLRNQAVGFIFQSFNLLGSSSVYDNVEMPLLYSANISPHERRSAVESAIAAVGLQDKINVEASRLSGGQKQRVAIARALVNKPKVIFADEPTGNLDSVSGAQVMEILSNLHKQGNTIILVTHETYTSEFAERLIRIRDGQVEFDQPISKTRQSSSEFFK